MPSLRHAQNFALSFVVLALLMWSATGCGDDVENAGSCTVEEHESETVITCDDGSRATVPHGEDGRDGEDGHDGDCHIVDNEDGTADIVCDDGEYTLPAGSCDTFDGDFAVANMLDLALFENMGCTEVNGDITVDSSGITDLQGLESLEVVQGSLKIVNNDGLEELTGLDSLTSVAGDLTIAHNDELPDLTGLDSLNEVQGSLLIHSNEGLLTIEGLDSLESVHGHIQIRENPAIHDASGLDTIETPGSLLEFTKNQTLETLPDLSGVTSLHGDLIIDGNDSLESITGFNDLESIEGAIRLQNNDSLVSIDAFDSLVDVGKLRVNNNAALEFFPVFEALEQIHPHHADNELTPRVLEIRANDSLETIDGFPSLDTVTGKAEGNTILSPPTPDWLVRIEANEVLEDISGFQNLETIDNKAESDSEPTFLIFNNPSLPDCHINYVFQDIDVDEVFTSAWNDEDADC